MSVAAGRLRACITKLNSTLADLDAHAVFMTNYAEGVSCLIQEYVTADVPLAISTADFDTLANTFSAQMKMSDALRVHMEGFRVLDVHKANFEQRSRLQQAFGTLNTYLSEWKTKAVSVDAAAAAARQ